MIKSREDVPKLTIVRMALYYNTLQKMKEEGEEICASTQLSQRTGLNSSIIRRDLACFGDFGTKGVGYQIEFLLSWIREILGYNTNWNVLLIGMGIPITGTINCYDFFPPAFKIVAIADLDKNNHGYTIPGLNLTIQPLKNLPSIIKEHEISIGMINVLPKQAQRVVDMMVKGGIKGIANFSGVAVQVPEHISLSQLNVASCLSQLSYRLNIGMSARYKRRAETI
ncbi:MAG: rex 1 [Firmicutes bacterium]|nr:rex 1 [Bacillota bacterium]